MLFELLFPDENQLDAGYVALADPYMTLLTFV